jgi:hypothetical protein
MILLEASLRITAIAAMVALILTVLRFARATHVMRRGRSCSPQCC